MRSAFRSLTMISDGVALLGLIVVATVDPVGDLIARHQPKYRSDIVDIQRIVKAIAFTTGIGGVGGVAAGRLRVGDLFTPPGLPGQNKADSIEQYLASVGTPIDSVPNEQPIESVSINRPIGVRGGRCVRH